MELGKILEFRRDLYFEGAVQADWFYSQEKAAKVAENFVFHGKQYFGVEDQGAGKKRKIRDNLMTDEVAFDIVNAVYMEINGQEIRWDEGLSASNILEMLISEYCGINGRFEHVILLFDEFGRYLEYASGVNAAKSGDSALQQIFETAQNANGVLQVINFIQSDIKTYLQRVDQTKNISRYIGRYDASDKYYISSNLETVFANLIQRKDKIAFEENIIAWQKNNENLWKNIFEKLNRWLVTKGMWRDYTLFRKVIVEGIYPMHPISTFMLTQLSDYLQNRSSLTLSKEENLHRYEKNAFDAIVIDEAHHSSANSYKKVLDYFEPKLWLGMTATPDKRDDNLEGRNIYEIFNHQIAYEIRLQDAMEEDLLCPFHYFGITDLDIIADAGKSSEEKVENFRYLTSEERVENVMKQAEYFGYSGDRVKGLIFCSRIDEAKELSKKFNDKGWRTLVLSGSDSEEARAAAIERLAGEASEDALDYIISVDIFSEGVDVPEINQVIMLRPTESPIVFIQQLGRGLRKAENKEYVVVLDFIGNYRNNFMIPIALSGDRSYNKDNIRRYVTEGGRVIPGASTIHFDEISRKRIFQAIDNANFSDIKLIRENYTNLKNKLGHIPALADFDKYGEMDVLRIFDNNSLGSYYKFLVKYEKEYTIRLSEDEEKAIEFISKKLANGKRIHELELLKRMLQYRHGIIGRLQKHLSEKYHCEMDEHCMENVVNMMTNEFPTSAAKKTYAQCVFLKKEQDDYGISDVYGKMLENPEFCAILEELIDFGISRYKVNYSYHYRDTNLVLYQKYTYEDACRLLNWERNEVPLNIGGYKYDKKTKTFPIFINYDKQDNISDTTKYEDHFVAENRLIAISKSGRSMDSEDVQNFLNATERGIDVQLFVRKNKDDKISKEFYYLGRVIATGNAKQFVMPNTDKTAVEIEWELETPVREDIYQYIVNE